MSESTDLLNQFFEGYPESRQLFDAFYNQLISIGSVDMRVTKSQISFLRTRPFVRVWIPDKYLHGKHAPLVLTFSFDSRDSSARWKEIVEPYPGKFTHHLEIYSTQDLDTQVLEWLRMAWLSA